MLNASLKELSAALAQKKISGAELTKLFLDRISRLNGSLNAFITVDAGKSLAQAHAADERIAKGAAQPLTGIPVAHKDIFVTRDWLTTCGSRILSNFVGPYDAHVIERFNDAGAVILGKTNMDEFAMGSSTETSFYRPVRNPWGQAYGPSKSRARACASACRRSILARGLPPTWARPWRRRSGNSRSSAQRASRSVCRTAVIRFRRTTLSRRLKLLRTCRASTACATVTARRITATSPTCTAARAPRASALKSGAAFLSAPMFSLTATTTPTTSRRRRYGG